VELLAIWNIAVSAFSSCVGWAGVGRGACARAYMSIDGTGEEALATWGTTSEREGEGKLKWWGAE